MKPASFLIGLSMLFALGACAAPYGEDGSSAPAQGTREEAVLSADQEAAVGALRSRVQEDFVNVPSLKGHEIIVITQRISGTPDEIAIQAKLMKRTPAGTEMELSDADFVDAIKGEIRVASPYRSEIMAVLVRAKDSHWSTLKSGILGSKAVEAYVSGQSPEAFEGWSEDFMVNRGHQSRTPFNGQ